MRALLADGGMALAVAPAANESSGGAAVSLGRYGGRRSATGCCTAWR